MTASSPRFVFPPTPSPGGPDLRAIRQRPPGAEAQWLGYAGSVLLLLGLFLPVFAVGSRSILLWELGLLDGFPSAFALVLTLALASAAASLRRAFLFLALAGFVTYLTLAVACVDVERMAKMMPLADALGQLPLLVEVDPPRATFAAGWYVLLLGALLVLAGAGVGEYRNSQERVRRPHDDEFVPPPRSPWQRLLDTESAWLSPN